MIGIIGAMEEEVLELKLIIENMRTEVKGPFTYYTGYISNQPVVLVQSGVGKSLAAMSATALVINYPVSKVINIGSAGSLDKELNIGDVIVSNYIALSDFDLTAFGYEKGFNQARYSFKANAELIDLAKKINIEHVHFGNMVSSDSFIHQAEQVENILNDYAGALCADMEAGSIAMVLDKLNIPFIVIRSISDNVMDSSDNKVDFETYLKTASKNSANITKQLISSM